MREFLWFQQRWYRCTNICKMKHAGMMIYLFAILCYCIGFYFLWQDPDDAFHKFLFYSFTSIPVGLFCYKYARGKKVNLIGRDKIINVLLIGIFVVLGFSIMLLSLIDFPKEHRVWFNTIFALFVISTITVIVWSQIIKQKKK